MLNFVISVVILAILGAALTYIYIAKKNGAKCIGCPSAGKCASCKGGCACHGADAQVEATPECGGCGTQSGTDEV